jgi:hypothetical protein
MSRDILSGVTFTPANRKLDFSGVAGFDPRRLRTVIHGPTNAPLYLLGGGKALGGTWTGNVLTLAIDTTALAANDPLTVTVSDDALATIARRGLFFVDATNVSVGVNAQFFGTLRDAGADAAFTRINGLLFSNKDGTLQVFQSQDAAGGTQFVTKSVPIASNTFVTISDVLFCRYARVVYSNQATAATINLSSSLLA